MEWLISDNHFDHLNILQFEKETRGQFKDIGEMNKHMIDKWNETVQPNDTVYYIGDFGMNIKYTRWVELLSQLNGIIVLISGNHDDTKTVKRLENDGLILLHEVGLKLKRNKHIMWLTHYPMEIGLRPRKWSVSGHIHSTPSTYKNQLNVGVDSPLMKQLGKKFGEPISMDELLSYMDSITPEIESYYSNLRGE